MISCVERRALVKIFGGGKLGGVSRILSICHSQIVLTGELKLILKRGQSDLGAVPIET